MAMGRDPYLSRWGSDLQLNHIAIGISDVREWVSWRPFTPFQQLATCSLCFFDRPIELTLVRESESEVVYSAGPTCLFRYFIQRDRVRCWVGARRPSWNRHGTTPRRRILLDRSEATGQDRRRKDDLEEGVGPRRKLNRWLWAMLSLVDLGQVT